jgi:hypothetical protein
MATRRRRGGDGDGSGGAVESRVSVVCLTLLVFGGPLKAHYSNSFIFFLFFLSRFLFFLFSYCVLN